MSFLKLNKIISQLPEQHISSTLLRAKEPGSYNALTQDKMSCIVDDATSVFVVPGDISIESSELKESTPDVSSSRSQLVVQRNLFQKITKLLQLLSPWMVTFIFVKTLLSANKEYRRIK